MHPETVSLPPGPMRLVDLSQRLSNATRAFEPNPHSIEYLDHAAAGKLTGAYGVEPELWEGGEAWAVEVVTLSTHSGTHIDAPYHYAATTAGRPARSIDDVPLHWCLGQGVVLNFAHKRAGEGIEATELEPALAAAGHDLRPLDIVLIRTDASRRFESAGYEREQPGLRLSATEWLVDHGVRLIGIDAWGLDRPLDVMAAEARDGDRGQLWESHLLGRRKEYCQIEKLVNLDRLPRTGFFVSALPVKLADAGAAWSRVVAFVPDGDR